MDQVSVIIDFDGTITMQDVSELILVEFAEGDWLEVEERANAGEISMNECMIQQYGMIRGDLDQIMSRGRSIEIRPFFDAFLDHTVELGAEVICVSAGLSFIIDDFIERNKWQLEYIAPQARWTSRGIELQLVEFNSTLYRDFKEHHVRERQANGRKVIYIGDGSSDVEGAKYADLRFCVRGKSLSERLNKEDLPFEEFDDFREIQIAIDEFSL